MIKAISRGFADLSQNVGNSRRDVGDWANVHAAKVREDGHMAYHAPNADDPLPESNRTTDGARLNPSAMPIADTARVLTRLGGQNVTEEMLRTDIAAGAPANPDGSLHLTHYAAWLVKEMSRGDD